MSFRRLSAALAVGSLTAIVPALPAHAAPVVCGAVLTSSTSLTANLHCPGSTITLRGNNIKINFRGFTLSGNGTSTGVRLEGTGLRVEHGSIKGFDRGVSIDDAEVEGWFAKVSDMSISNNRVGVETANARVHVIGSRILDNTFEGLGVAEFQATGAYTVIKSTLARNGTAMGLTSDFATTYASLSVFEDNRIGIACSQSKFVVMDNRFVRNSIGILPFLCDGSRIERNQLFGNDVAVDIEENSIRAYEVQDNYLYANGIGIRVLPQSISNIVGNSFRGNRIGLASIASPGAGLLPDVATQLKANGFYGNGNGVLLQHEMNIVISDNKAFNNRGWGIYTVGGVDGGGNTAGGNTEPAQCFGVVCS